ncbi:uncharacterized protein PB18E9.04c-like isoform X2 [Pomacea canaliculata]|uniref:uncharacterized protein PB18E9.04c-like isoform X2 n=1 Tax=Pomacea canaliculata TaxID=400727 RepID=UPI000D73CC56|nr:uncharacterized protein PB18E9.04c-like isoform X2 [Pomacea canaliculata]
MEIWKGGSLRPAVYNIMRYNPTTPDVGVFDFATCYDASNKKHFTIEFKVVNPKNFILLGRPYLRETVVVQLASHLEIQPNRFTDVTFDYDQHGTLFMSGTMLGPSKVNGFGRREIDLNGAFDFLKGSVAASHLAIMLSDSDGEPMPLEGVNVVEHNFHEEFTTTTTTTAKPTSIVVPTLPPKTISMKVPTAPPTTATTTSTTRTSTNTRTATCPLPTPCTCPTVRSIPPTTPLVSSSVRTSRLTSPSTRLAATTRLTCPPPPPPCNCSHLVQSTPFPSLLPAANRSSPAHLLLAARALRPRPALPRKSSRARRGRLPARAPPPDPVSPAQQQPWLSSAPLARRVPLRQGVHVHHPPCTSISHPPVTSSFPTHPSASRITALGH